MSLNQKRNRKLKLLNEQNHQCCYCGEKLSYEEATLDHVIPKAFGYISNFGMNSVDNLLCCCRDCNQGFSSTAPKHKILVLSKKLSFV